MIEGVDILNRVEILKKEPSAATWAIVVGCALLIVAAVICVLFTHDVKKIISMFIGALAIGMLGVAFIPKTYIEVPVGYQYDIYTEDIDVINKLYDKYEVIDVNSNVYTVNWYIP